MKISNNAISQFRKVCINEDKTSKADVIYKITRDMELGTIITITGEESYIVAFGELRILCEKGVVKSVWKDTTKSFRSSPYKKYKYNYEHGRDDLNAKYN